MRAKICGITNLSDAFYAIEQGVWALGFNFYKESLRFIETSMATKIIQKLPNQILKIGIVQDVNGIDVSSFMTRVGIDFLQVYEEVDVPLSLKKRMILSVSSAIDLPQEDILNQYGYVLLDAAKMQGELPGGTGRFSDWSIAKQLAKKHRLILAGGLTPENVQNALSVVKPFAVDTASGVQKTPGVLDHSLVKQFLRQVNHAA